MPKILIVDDDAGILQALHLALTFGRSAYNVEVAQSGKEAREAIRETPPSLIFLDMLLSGEDGTDICREIKSQEKTKHIPVVMMSAHPSAVRAIKDSGADAFLAKPFSVSVLRDMTKKFVGV